jgi:hypothetical protein
MPKTGPEFTPWEIKTKNEEKKNETKRIFLRKKREALFEGSCFSLVWFKIIFKADQSVL